MATAEDADGLDPPRARSPDRRSTQVEDDVDRARELGVDGGGGQVGQGAEGLEPRHHVLRRIGVHGPAAPLVTGVQGGQQLAHLRPPHLTHDQAVRPHPQRLSDQRRQGHLTGALDVRGTRLQPDDVPVGDAQLPHVLDDDESLVRADLRQERSEQRGLSGTRTMAH